jgi:uncharacterized protein YutE (UPF0331/DUF86 family)
MPVDAVILRRRIREMERAIRVLRQLRAAGRDAFINDEATQDRVARNAQLLAQLCADIALHILAATGEASPETYGAALLELARAGRIPQAVGETLAGAVGLRNLLVHAYLEIDYGRIHDELGWIEDAVQFATAIETWLESLEHR